ncbi:MAG: hypothetical protein QOG23_2361 [Blastocatellia bacterium]|jgi:hypothetical protein|nr:hypothetical protein [Blastocatellia bacterium]
MLFIRESQSQKNRLKVIWQQLGYYRLHDKYCSELRVEQPNDIMAVSSS